jgi:outer membrane protein assembly factor BamB
VVSKSGAGLSVAPLWVNKEVKTNLATPVQVGTLVFNQGMSKSKEYVCFDAATGAKKWAETGFGGATQDYSSTIIVGKNLLVLTYSGELVLIAPNADKYTELGRLQVCGTTWSFPAYVDGKIYVRDTKQLRCIDLLAVK